MAHVSDAKKKIVAEYVKLIKEYPIVGTVNFESLPSRTQQQMRETLRNDVVIKMNKRRLMKIALEQCAKDKPGVEELFSRMRGMPALIFTKTNPFKLYKTLQKNKSTTAAKAGQTAPKDIVVKAGPTGFAPGPVIGQLGAFKIKAGIENGKVAIKEDAVVAKEGDVINAELAGILSRLGIEPMEIGLDLTAAYEDGIIYGKDILAVDEEQYINDLTAAHSMAFNLGVEANIFADVIVEHLITKAAQEGKNLALESNILTKDTVDLILAKAEGQGRGLAFALPDDARPESLKGASAPTATVAAAAPEEKKEDKEEQKEEQSQAAIGLGSLFG